jgi:hypothetical protein
VTRNPVLTSLRRREVYDALSDPRRRKAAVARALDILEQEPLASAGAFPGDLIRRLMDLPPAFWRECPAFDARYRDAVRAAALERRTAADAVRLGFWRGLPERLGP